MEAPVTKFAGKLVPQTRELRKIRTIVQQIHLGVRDRHELAAAISQGERHADYARAAAETLGLLHVVGTEPCLTPAGRQLLTLREGSLEEREWYKKAISSSALLQIIAPGLLSRKPPTASVVARRIVTHADGLRASTAENRASVLLAWRSQLVATEQLSLWPRPVLPDDLVQNIIRENPWWEGEPAKLLPSFRRHFVDDIRARMDADVAPIVAVRGPRQVGKTTAQLQIIEQLLREGVSPKRILRVQWDDSPLLAKLGDPIRRVVDWYTSQILQGSLNAAAHTTGRVFIFMDEVQNLRDWHVQLKQLVDCSTVSIVITGSSALRIEAGRDSLAGRLSTVEVGTLGVREIATLRDFGDVPPLLPLHDPQGALVRPEFWRDAVASGEAHSAARSLAFSAFSLRGGYPMVHQRGGEVPWAIAADQLVETVIRKVIQHDLRAGLPGMPRDAALMEAVFRLSCRYAGQCVSRKSLTDELRASLNANLGEVRVSAYSDLLHKTLLLRLVQPLELRLKKLRSPPKICLADHGLRAAWLQELVPIHTDGLNDNTEACDLAGHLAESVLGAFFLSVPGLDVAHFPGNASEPEVDFVLTLGDRRIPIEVKYRRGFKSQDFQGIRSFLSKAVYRAPFGVVVVRDDSPPISEPGVIGIPLSSLLLMR